MASIPLTAALVKPVEQPDALQNFSRLAQLRGLQQEVAQRAAMAPYQQQAAQQQAQLQQQQIQMNQQEMAARQALNQAYANSVTTDASGKPVFDENKLQQSLATGPAAFQTPEIMKGLAAFKKSQIDLQDSVMGLQAKQQDMLGQAASAIKASGYSSAVAHALLDQFPQNPQMDAVRQQIDNPQILKQWVDTSIANSPAQQKLQNTVDVAKIRSGTPDKMAMDSWIASEQAKGNNVTPADWEKHKIDLQTEATIQRETDPRAMAAKERLAAVEAAARQSVSQGDPKTAAQLLVNGDATLSELKSRGATPQFIAQTLFNARQLSGGKYNAQEAESNFNVAKSPANVAFFGSAKSLVDKGGTLDQLAETAKKIPQNQFPVLNSLEDWTKEAAGSGPLAEYAARVLGVADDYSKVMGGGQGSDTSRLQAANLISKKLSKEGREGAIAGIRGSVNSQIDSRIGNNPIMKRMYGRQQETQQNAGAPLKITLPSGKQISIE